MTPGPHAVRVLISPDSAWPPPGCEKLRARWPSWSAWWSGDLDDLAKHAPVTAPGGYWSKRDKHPDDRHVHLPLASDIARTSAELIFGDSATMKWPSGQDEWDELAQTIGWGNSLLEAAEVCDSLGGVYLRPAWDKGIADHPLTTAVAADEAVPEFRFGVLVGVVFVSDLGERDGYVWRHLEHHERGQIRHELWRGTTTNIGRLVPLTDQPETRGYADPGNGGGVIDTRPIRPDGGLLVEFVPNALPQPLHRQPYGRPDIQGQETLLDALDSTWASWMRDLDLGKGRLIVPAEFLDNVTGPAPSRVQTATGRWFGRRNSTPSKAFDEDARLFTPMPGMPADDGGKAAPITNVQFALRVQEHADTATALIEQIVSRCGYSPQTFGYDVEGQISGTARRLRERRSYKTRDRKRQYWRPHLERYAETLMRINAVVFNGAAPADRPTLEWRETDQADPKETAETVEILRRAEAISDATAVGMAHPDWDDKQIEAEVRDIAAQRAANRVADPFTGHETPDQAGTEGEQPSGEDDETGR